MKSFSVAWLTDVPWLTVTSSLVGFCALVGVFTPLRVSQQQELEGLDISQHGEALQ